jgi:hypothetical protein
VEVVDPKPSPPGNGKPKWSEIIAGCADDLPLGKLLKNPKELNI